MTQQLHSYGVGLRGVKTYVCTYKILYMNVRGRVMHSGWKGETAQTSITVEQQNVVDPYKGISFGIKRSDVLIPATGRVNCENVFLS